MTQDELQATFFDYLVKIGTPRDIATLASSQLYETKATANATSWWNTNGPDHSPSCRLLVLSGGNGSGKTLAACNLLRGHTRDNGKRAFIHEPGDLTGWWVWRGALFRVSRHVALLNSHNYDDGGEIRAIENTPVLILDEAGGEDGDAERTIGALLCNRLANDQLRTIVTTNLNRDVFEKRFGGRLASRLAGNGAFCIVHSDDQRRVSEAK
jgi:DNA replication protein DnaC